MQIFGVLGQLNLFCGLALEIQKIEFIGFCYKILFCVFKNLPKVTPFLTTHAIISLIDNIEKAMNNLFVRRNFIDLQKAFDTIDNIAS